MKPTRDAEYQDAIADLLANRDVLRMASIRHHDDSTLTHCLAVSRLSYATARALRLDAVSTARGALLHDFFLYDWHDGTNPHHATGHARVALDNAMARFDLNAVEADIILTHMWPVGGPFYTYKESMLVSTFDKVVGTRDLVVDLTHGLLSLLHSVVSRIRASIV